MYIQISVVALCLACLRRADAKPKPCPSIQPYCVTEADAGPKVRCGEHGHITSKSHVVRSRCISSFEDCRNTCLANSKCHAFGYNSPTNACTIYPSASAKTKFKQGRKNTLFYDKKCFSFHPIDASSLVFISSTYPEDNNMYPGFTNREQESVAILGLLSNASIFAIDPSSGALSTLDENGGAVTANQNDDDFGQELYFNSQDEIDSGGYEEAVCSLSSDLSLHCDSGHNRTIMFDDGGVVALGSPTDAAGYPTLTLTAVC